jgi:FkbM family methyltransferase
MSLNKRDIYINSPSPIDSDLRDLFERNAPLVIFDIGSCEGEDSIRYSRLFSNARIYAFEPLPHNLEMIKFQIEKYNAKNVSFFQIALGDEIGEADFFISSGQQDKTVPKEDWDFGNKSSSLLAPHENIKQIFPWLEFSEKIKVPVNTLENFCAQHGVQKIDFIHLDVQGAELKVLLGAGDNIKKINVVWMEVENIPLYEGQPLKQDVENFMRKHGFVKVVDAVSDQAGDQLYVNFKFLWKRPLAVLKFLIKNLFK